MTSIENWEEALQYFLTRFSKDGDENVMAIANICRYIINEYSGIPLEVKKRHDTILYIAPANGIAPNKEFVIMPIDGNEVEMYIQDKETGIQYCYIPHTDYSEAPNRFKKIINKLDWNSPVKPNSLFRDWLS